MSKDSVVRLVKAKLELQERDRSIRFEPRGGKIGDVVDAVFESITDELSAGRDVSYTGFGTFKVQERAARTGRNPQTGEPMQIAASKTVTFKPAQAIKSRL